MLSLNCIFSQTFRRHVTQMYKFNGRSKFSQNSVTPTQTVFVYVVRTFMQLIAQCSLL